MKTPLAAFFLKAWGTEFGGYIFPVLRQESARWLFVFRATLAAFLALWISMLLQLDKPFMAMASVIIVMQPHSGAVLARSVYRMLGNFAGGAVAVLLFALFEQQTALLLGGLALWVLFCTAGAARQRNAQSYGFVLAGYTACIVALPELSTPEHVFVTATLRISEIMVGILCACVVSEIIFPETVSKVFYSAAQKRFGTFEDFVRNVLSGRIRQDEVEAMQLRFISDVAALDGYGAAASMEVGASVHKERVRLFNSGFMSVSTSFYALYAFTRDFLPSASPTARGAVEAALEEVASALGSEGQGDRTAGTAREKALTMAACREAMRRNLLGKAADSRLSLPDVGILKAATHILGRFLADMHDYLLRYAELDMPASRKAAARPVRFTPNIDRSIPVMSGLRAAMLLLALSLCWWAAAWPDPNGSNMTSIAVAFCALRAADANPTRSIYITCLGAVAGVLASNIYSFFVLPHITGLPPLLSSYFPFLGIGLYCCTIPAIAGPARMYCIVLSSFSGLSPAFSVDPADLVSRSIAEVMGIASAGVLHMLFFPVGGLWWQSRLRKALLREASAACSFRLNSVEHYFESGIRDILLQFTANTITSREDKQEMLKQTLAVSSLGRTIIELREYLAGENCSPAGKKACIPVLSRLELFLKNPSSARLESVERQLRYALEELAAVGELRSEDAVEAAVPGDPPGSASMLLRILRKEFALAVEDLGLRESGSTPNQSEVGHAA